MKDTIYRQGAIDLWEKYHHTIAVDAMQYDAELRQLPSAPEPAIPISWLMEEIKRLESRKNCLTVIDVAQLKAHIKRWESEQNE